MGGRLDSTNVVRPAVSVITNISFDHTRQLGHTLAAIAGEKAGILKRGRPAVSGERGAEARAVIRRVARAAALPVFARSARDFRYEFLPPGPPLTRPTAGRVAVRTWRTDWGTLTLPLLGAAPGAQRRGGPGGARRPGRAGAGRGPRGRRPRVRRAALAGAGRGARRVPWLVIDGAHNVASAEALAETLADLLPAGASHARFRHDPRKGPSRPAPRLAPGSSTVVATRYVENPRSVPPEEVASVVARNLRDGPPHRHRTPPRPSNRRRRLTPARRPDLRDGLTVPRRRDAGDRPRRETGQRARAGDDLIASAGLSASDRCLVRA